MIKTRLQRQYEKAVKENQQTFMFKGQEMDTTYVKYLLEYQQLKTAKN